MYQQLHQFSPKQFRRYYTLEGEKVPSISSRIIALQPFFLFSCLNGLARVDFRGRRTAVGWALSDERTLCRDLCLLSGKQTRWRKKVAKKAVTEEASKKLQKKGGKRLFCTLLAAILHYRRPLQVATSIEGYHANPFFGAAQCTCKGWSGFINARRDNDAWSERKKRENAARERSTNSWKVFVATLWIWR